jgi:hypothetical protein
MQQTAAVAEFHRATTASKTQKSTHALAGELLHILRPIVHCLFRLGFVFVSFLIENQWSL